MTSSLVGSEMCIRDREKEIDIMLLQSTLQEHNSKEHHRGYHFYFSSTPRLDPTIRHNAGVAFVLSDKAHRHLVDIEPISDRIQRLTLKSSVLITFINIYAPPALRPEEEKEVFYEKLSEVYRTWAPRGPTIIAGDWNARLQARLTEEEQYLGIHFFDRLNTTLERQ
eukprot:51875-Prorocentrum_lima.AAC.1